MRRILFLISVVLSVVSSGADTLSQIAVSPLTGEGLQKNEFSALTNALRSELGRIEKFTVMERTKMDDILREQGFQQSGLCDATQCAMELGKLLSVEQVVIGNIDKVGKTYTFNVRIVEVRTGTILMDVTEYHKGITDELLTKVLPVIVKKISGKKVEKKKRKGGIIASVVAGVSAAAAVPIIIILSNDDEEKQSETFDFNVIW